MLADHVPLQSLNCPACGGPLPGSARWATTTCRFCGATVANDQRVVAAAEYHAARARYEAEAARGLPFAGASWEVCAPLGIGAHAEVLLTARSRRLSELAVVHVLHPGADPAALTRTWATLAALAASPARGGDALSRRLPAPVARGPWSGGAPAIALSAHPGFTHTLAELGRLFPAGPDARHLVWIWRRVLELLSFVHGSGFVHGAIRPEHLLVNAREHGALLVGWSAAQRDAAPATDLAALSTTLRAVWPAPPAPLAALLDEAPAFAALSLHARVAEVARAVYGPPVFVPLHLPGRRA